MAFTQKTLKQSATLTASFAALLTVGSNQRATITKFTVHNYSASAAVITARVVESGGTGADSHQIYEKTLDANETLDLAALRHTLEPGDFVEAKADTASALNVRISGLVTTV